MKCTVIIPVYNEIQTIAEVLRRIQAVGVADEIIIVDDGSKDGTREYISQLNQPQIKAILHTHNQGKGAAVITGIKQSSGDILIIQDADLEYNPTDFPALLKPILEGNADVVYGSRFLVNDLSHFLFWNRVANRLLTWLTNLLYGKHLTDMETGYKVFKRELVKDIPLHSRRFDFEPEFTAKICKRNLRLCEVPIQFSPRDYTQGKKIKISDAFSAVWALIKYRFVE
jgi:glycosyltransferase involved in cell wall biosynthesis